MTSTLSGTREGRFAPAWLCRPSGSAALLILLLYSFLAVCSSQSSVAAHGAPPANLSFAHVLPDQVETLGHVNAIATDQQGFVWFGGSSGLARYDGYSLKIFRHLSSDPRSLSHNMVNRLLLDRQGRLWVATEAGLSHYVPQTEDFTVYRHPQAVEESVARNSIRAMVEDASGAIWLGTSAGLERFQPESARFKHFNYAKEAPSGSGNSTVWDIARGASGELWLASQTDGVVRFDTQQREFSFFKLSAGFTTEVDVRSVYVDRQNRLWVGTYKGNVYQLNRDSRTFRLLEHHDQVRKDVVWAIWQDQQNRLWVGDGGGLNLLDGASGQLHRYQYNEAVPSGPANYVVRALHEGPAGDLWLGYFPSGVDRLDQQASAFRNFRHLPHDRNSLTEGGVLAAVEDSAQNLWIGTSFGLTYYDRKAETYTRYFHDAKDPNSILGSTVLSLLIDRHNNLWIGSWSKGITKLNLDTGQSKRYSYDVDDPSTLLGVEPWRMIEDSRGDVWIATELGVSRYDPGAGRFFRYLPTDKQMGGDSRLYTRELYEDRQGNLWVGSDRGLFVLNRSTGAFTRFSSRDGDSRSISADFIGAIFEDSRGILWIGTQGGGLNLMDRARGTFTAFGAVDGLADEVVTSVTEDRRGDLWLTTQRGVSRFEVAKRTFKNFDKRHGLLDNLFNRNTALTTSRGELFFGSTKGFTLLDPGKLIHNTFIAPVVFTALEVFNQPVELGDTDAPFSEAIAVSDTVTFNHNQSVFSLAFAALSFQLPEQNQYAYQLQGFDTQWQHVGNKREATYTNLDPGKYIFQVRAANNDGVWNHAGRAIDVIVLPPPWQTWWAYLSYALLALCLLLFFVHMKLKRMELVQEKKVNARLRKLDKIKDSFLANTSHELRTPLNGMIGIAEALLDDRDEAISPEGRKKLNMIRASGRRLANLVNDILDYAKLTENSLDIKLRPVNVHALVYEVECLLRPLADLKNIELRNNIDESTPWLMGDENRLQQILINLVGNAIKFTERGHVELAVDDLGQYLQLEVRDTGAGIKEEDIASVFVAFHQLEAGNEQCSAGTGLGLAITKQLVELQGGEIGLSSGFGQGSVFRFVLRKAETQAGKPKPPPTAESNIEPFIHRPMRGGEVAAEAIALVDHPEQYRVLVVDDDPVNCIVLRGILQQHRYRSAEASSGSEALAILDNGEAVDLVILDVMMPRMNGFETCRAIRERFAIHELPVLFLTAQKVDADLLQGFAAGGNEFLTKPVSKYELLALVANHLRLLTANRQLRAAAVRVS